MVDWMVGWKDGCLIDGWMKCWLVSQLVELTVGWLISLVGGLLIGWSVG